MLYSNIFVHTTLTRYVDWYIFSYLKHCTDCRSTLGGTIKVNPVASRIGQPCLTYSLTIYLVCHRELVGILLLTTDIGKL